MSNQQPVIRALLDYYAAFNTLDAKATLPYFHEPAFLIGAQGVFAASTHDILAPVLASAIDSLRARGFGRSELTIQRVESLTISTNLVPGVAVRYKVDGQELERVGITYVLQNADNCWKIAVLITHGPN
jgi:hypothetical protein